MLNVLIAQMSDTYTKVQRNAIALATFHRARFLLRYLKFYEHWHSRAGNNATEVSIPGIAGFAVQSAAYEHVTSTVPVYSKCNS